MTAVAEQGYSVEKLTPRSTGDILWEQTSNRFALVKDNEIVFGDDTTTAELGYTYWKITSDLKEVSTGKYSYYLAEEVDESALTAALEVSTGLDVGNNSNVSISYANNEASATAQNVIFRTNGGELTVNGSQDTVSHYGSLVTADVQAVANNSYHEYGTVLGNIKVAQGRVVLENKSEVATVVVTTTSDSLAGTTLDEVVKIENNSGNSTTVAATDSTVASNLESVVTGEADVSTDAVAEDDLNMFAGGLGTEASPYLIANESQFNNIALLSEEMRQGKGCSFEVVNDLYLTNLEGMIFSGTFDGGNYVISSDGSGPIFGYGVGTTKFENIVLEQPEEFFPLCYYAGINGKTTFYNITVREIDESQNSQPAFYGISSFCCQTYGYTEFINCINEVDYTIPTNGSNNYGGIFVGNYAVGGDAYAIVFENCVNKGIVTGGKVGFFVGNVNAATFVIVENKEDITTNTDTVKIYVDNCSNESTITGTEYCRPFIVVNSFQDIQVQEVNAYLSSNTQAFMPGNMIEGGVNGTLSLAGNSLVVDVLGNSSIAKVKVTYTVSTGYKDANGNSLGSFYFSVAEEVEVSELATHNFAYVSKIISSSEYGEEEYSNINSEEKTDVYGHKYKIIDGSDGYKTVVVNHSSLCENYDSLATVATIGSNPTYSLIMFNSAGTLIGSVAYAYGTIPQV